MYRCVFFANTFGFRFLIFFCCTETGRIGAKMAKRGFPKRCVLTCVWNSVSMLCVCRAIRPKIILLCYRFRFNTLVRWWGRSRSFAPSPSRTNNNIIVFCGSILAEGRAFPSKRNLLLKKEWKGPLLGGGIETRVPWPGKSIIPKFYEFRISIFLEVSDFRFFAVF